MRQILVLLLGSVFLLMFVSAGCESMPKEKVGVFDNEKMVLTGQTGTVYCDKCKQDVPAGTWCPKCNRIVLPGTVHCDQCGKDIPKGTYCPICKKYVGVPNVAYCETCKRPYNVEEGCPVCGHK
jgi:hypothetical protein